MTLPDERYRALKRARKFLEDLLDPSITPRIPLKIRREARYVLKHYPWDLYLDQLAATRPDILKNNG